MATFETSDAESLSVDELRERLAGLTRLLDVTRTLAEEIDLDKLLDTLTREACNALDCERASLFQYDGKNHELYTRVATELEIEEIRTSIDCGITGHVARTREVTNIVDPYADPRWNSSVDQRTGFRTRSILAAPLTSPHDQSLLGVLQLLNKRSGHFDTFDEDLIRAFSQHAAVAIDRARMIRELSRRHELAASLNVARDIQRGFMPRELPQPPGYQLAQWWFPNAAVGGDYMDVFRLAGNRLGMVIADVCGHGLGPSLIMATVRAALRALMLDHNSPDKLLEQLDRAMATDLQDGRFVTAVLARLDLNTHQVDFANAGHGPALHYAAAQDRFEVLQSTSTPLGIIENAQYPLGPPVVMEPGDLLLLCTDGIVEAVNTRDEQFGAERLEAILRDNRSGDATEIVEALAEKVQSYYPGEHPDDDLTVLLVKRVA